MVTHAPHATRDTELNPRSPTPVARIIPDRRRHRRFELTLLGRFMRANRQEYPCKLIDVSVGGAGLLAPVQPEIGERIVAYFDHIGGIEGTVIRELQGGFAIRLHATQHKREKLAAQITYLVNRHELDPAEARRHERVTLISKTSTMKLSDDVAVPVRVLDVSISGASVGTEIRPPVGSEIVLGKLRARVVRHHGEGVGVQFLDIQNPEALRRYFG
jgi:hypothetical protein